MVRLGLRLGDYAARPGGRLYSTDKHPLVSGLNRGYVNEVSSRGTDRVQERDDHLLLKVNPRNRRRTLFSMNLLPQGIELFSVSQDNRYR